MDFHKDAEAVLGMLTAPRRNHFFYGKRMDVQHFEMEQNYGKRKQWLMNRLSLGKGVMCGLRVSVDGDCICVDPGVAIDGLGREIIVPVRSCIDPLATDDGCCAHHSKPASAPAQPRDAAAPDTAARAVAPAAGGDRPRNGIFTLWVCYRECFAEMQPVLVSDCSTQSHCAAGTIVETFCLKVTPGLAPLADPGWCAKLWDTPSAPPRDSGVAPGDSSHAAPSGATHGAVTGAGNGLLTTDQAAAIEAALKSKRHLLCTLFDCDCAPDDDEVCVPLAAIVLRDGKYWVESCLVRPRIYSNAKLLELILCLADKVDQCCNDHAPVETLRVSSVEFLSRNDRGAEQLIASVQTPLQDLHLPIASKVNAIRVRFTGALAQNQHKPATAGLGDPDFNLRNVLVLPDDVIAEPYVPGMLTLEAPNTLRFDLAAETRYRLRNGGWQKGRYALFLRGTEDLPNNRQALADSTDKALDGEPIAPASGTLSGDGTAGGDFKTFFVIGAGAPPPPEPEPTPEPAPTPVETMRVLSVEFLTRTPGGPEKRVGAVKDFARPPTIKIRFDSIRIRFTKPFSQDAKHVPTTHGLNDPAFRSHNVQVLVAKNEARARGIEYVPGSVTIEDPSTVRFDVLRGSRIVDREGNWPDGASHYQLFLRGTAQGAQTRAPLADMALAALDGEPNASGGVLSGDGAAGGQFLADFTVQR